jgi:hypothetical protein
LECLRFENGYIGILWPFGILNGISDIYDYMVHFMIIWYILSGFGIMYQEKSGNPSHSQKMTFSRLRGTQLFKMETFSRPGVMLALKWKL